MPRHDHREQLVGALRWQVVVVVACLAGGAAGCVWYRPKSLDEIEWGP